MIPPTDSLLDGPGRLLKVLVHLWDMAYLWGVVVNDTDPTVLIMSILLSPAVRWTPFAHIRENDGNLNI
jgi:hypothetical protein